MTNNRHSNVILICKSCGYLFQRIMIKIKRCALCGGVLEARKP